MIKLFLLLSVTIIFISCDSTTIQFNSTDWEADRFGCNGIREELLPEAEVILPELLSENKKTVEAVFGRPDITELNKRHLTNYLYFIEPRAQECKKSNNAKPTLAYCVEFNSLGRVSLISQQLR
ncbi:MAG: hypothetical protein AB8B61_05975 [Cyclobacteriaceae bacterium]